MSNFAQTSPSHGHLLPHWGKLTMNLSGWRVASSKEGNVDTTTLLIIVIIVLLLGGGGWYGRGRWY